MARVSCDGAETEGGSHLAQVLPLFPKGCRVWSLGSKTTGGRRFPVTTAGFLSPLDVYAENQFPVRG